ncbi:hypothetical protein B0H13DRAFT_1867887 [Mycena leptocephala]|nr:hypothetical protein B0H13DRAFT_1867887 [Mycena leptocephala]
MGPITAFDHRFLRRLISQAAASLYEKLPRPALHLAVHVRFTSDSRPSQLRPFGARRWLAPVHCFTSVEPRLLRRLISSGGKPLREAAASRIRHYILLRTSDSRPSQLRPFDARPWLAPVHCCPHSKSGSASLRHLRFRHGNGLVVSSEASNYLPHRTAHDFEGRPTFERAGIYNQCTQPGMLSERRTGWKQRALQMWSLPGCDWICARKHRAIHASLPGGAANIESENAAGKGSRNSVTKITTWMRLDVRRLHPPLPLPGAHGFQVAAGLVVSIALLLLSLPTSVLHKGIQDDKHIPTDGTGTLHAIWMCRNHAELEKLQRHVENPTINNLRETGMVWARLVRI